MTPVALRGKQRGARGVTVHLQARVDTENRGDRLADTRHPRLAAVVHAWGYESPAAPVGTPDGALDVRDER